MAVYDDLDLAFSWNGDYDVGHDGDLEDTSDDGLRSLREQLHDICASSLKDWEIYPKRSGDLDSFVGEPNSKSTAGRMHDRLKLAIISAGLVSEEDLDIKILPVHMNKVLILLKISAAPTPLNGLEKSGLVTSFLFDFLEQGTFFLDKPPKLLAD